MSVESLPRILNFGSAEYFHLKLIFTLVLARPTTELIALKSKPHFLLPVPEATDTDAGVQF